MPLNSQQSAREAYLESQVLTAPPHKQHLMLVEGAIRKANLALHEIEKGNEQLATTHLARCGQIAGELAICFKSTDDDLNLCVRAVYVFIVEKFREALQTLDVAKIHEALKVLSVEAETWRMVCAAGEKQSQVAAAHVALTTPAEMQEEEGFSLEA